MAPKKPAKRPPAKQFGMRLRDVERTYLIEAADRLSGQSPSEVGLGPFLRWAAFREAEKLLGVTLADYEAAQAKRGKGGGR
jgi:hypothetical protein